MSHVVLNDDGDNRKPVNTEKPIRQKPSTTRYDSFYDYQSPQQSTTSRYYGDCKSWNRGIAAHEPPGYNHHHYGRRYWFVSPPGSTTKRNDSAGLFPKWNPDEKRTPSRDITSSYRAGASPYLHPSPEMWLPEEFVPPRGDHSYHCSSSPARVTPIRPAGRTHGIACVSTDEDSRKGMIWKLGENDIVCGRGAPTNFQHGNQVFRDLITGYQTQYLCAKRSDKPRIARYLLHVIRSRGGRFVRRVKTSSGNAGRFGWEEIEEKRAYEKICQSLREGAPELRRRMLSSSSKFKESLAEDDENRRSHHDHGAGSF